LIGVGRKYHILVTPRVVSGNVGLPESTSMFRVAYCSFLLALIVAPVALFGLASHARDVGLSLLMISAVSLGIGLTRRP